MNKGRLRVRVKRVKKCEIEVGQGSLLPNLQYSVIRITFTDVVQIGHQMFHRLILQMRGCRWRLEDLFVPVENIFVCCFIARFIYSVHDTKSPK